MQIVVDSLLTRYQKLGQGKKLVVLHGWGDNGQSWLQLASELAKHYEVIIPDLPGFGGSQTPNSAWGLDEYAKFVANFLKKLEIQKIHALIGHSNGGAIALRGLSEGTLFAEKLVLLASAGIRSEYKGRTKTLRIVVKAGKVLSAPLPSTVKRKLRQKVYSSIGSDMLVAENLQESFKKVITDDVQADAANISVPTLLVYAENDDQTPVRYGESFHQLINGSILEVWPDAGHFLQLDQPEKLQHAIGEFLND